MYLETDLKSALSLEICSIKAIDSYMLINHTLSISNLSNIPHTSLKGLLFGCLSNKKHTNTLIFFFCQVIDINTLLSTPQYRE